MVSKTSKAINEALAGKKTLGLASSAFAALLAAGAIWPAAAVAISYIVGEKILDAIRGRK